MAKTVDLPPYPSMLRWIVLLVLAGCSARPATTPSNSATAPQPTNLLVAYLRDAERQLETPEQAAELRRALEDLATLMPDQLRARRYANAQLEPAMWTIEKILKSYLVPDKLVAIDEDEIVRDAQQPAARTLIREHIRAIDEHRQLRDRRSLLRN